MARRGVCLGGDLPRGVRPGGVSAWGGDLPRVYGQEGCLPRGIYLGVYASGDLPRGVWPGGVSAQGDLPRGVWPGGVSA